MGICCAKADTGPSIVEQIEEKLRHVSTVYPSSLPVCLLGEAGNLVSELASPKHTSQELARNMASMRRAANQFARSIDSKQAECSTLHVRGADNIFSLYVFDKIVLAFYSQIASTDMDEAKTDFVLRDKQIQNEVRLKRDQVRTSLEQSEKKVRTK